MRPNRIVSIMIFITILIIAASILTNRSLYTSAKNLETYIDSIEKNIKAENWSGADKDHKAVQNEWSKTQRFWTMLLDHFEIDNINATLSRMSKYIEAKDMPSALAEAATLRLYINHIPEKESFKLSNIF